MISNIKKFFTTFLDYALPNQCLACHNSVITPHSFCPNCWHNLNFITKPLCKTCGKGLPFVVGDNPCCLGCMHQPPTYDIARALLKFDDNSKKLIHNFKYYDKTILGTAFAKMLHNVYKEEMRNFDLFIPVPMYRLKRMFRFYNQSQVLAQELAKITQKPIYSDVLTKTRWTKQQSLLSKKERDNNLKGSFIVKNSHLIQDKRIILVDDVATTGSTIRACTNELKKYTSQIFVLCIAFTYR